MKRIRAITIGLIAIFLSGSLVLFPPAFFRVQEVVVTQPPKHLSEMDLIRLSQVRKGDSLLTLRLSKVRENLLRYPWIRDVKLLKRFPGRLEIWVEEQSPVALLELNESGTVSKYLVNRDGKIFKKLTPGDPKDLPAITGLTPQELPVFLKRFISFTQDFEKSPALKGVGISELHWGKDGLTLFTKEPCIKVEMGMNGWEESLGRLASSWETIRSTSKNPKAVNLSLKKGIVVKTRG
jgi:cell division septal protein FtsQ